jgi:hypothetical protein
MWWGRATNDYYSIITQAVLKLPDNTVEARLKLYNHARATLARQLEQEPTRIKRERRALEKSIRQVEKSSQQTYEPASTGLLIASIWLAGGLWVLDCTVMSAYWVVGRLPKTSGSRNELSLLAFRKAHIE